MKGCTLPPLHVVILAAGFSSRLGRPKALTTVNGRNLLERVSRTVGSLTELRSIIFIVPPRAARYRTRMAPRAAKFVANRRRSLGMSSSVRLGLRESRYAAGVLLLPVDLVELGRRDLERLISGWRGARRKVAARQLADREGHRPGLAATPLILPRWLIARARRTVDGDRGLREFVRGLAGDALRLVPMPSAQADLDTPEDLARARRRRRVAPR